MNKTAILVVTYNRKKLLAENIEAILSQTYSDFDFYICNNNSTDDTESYVLEQAEKDSRIKYFNTGENLGGAGGFAYGLNIILCRDYDYCWIMDDDSIPERDSLQELINAAKLIGKDNFSFLASNVLWTDGNPCIMNLCPPLPETVSEEFRQMSLEPIDRCSFVGCFINTDYARKVGLPIKEFFIYGDDTEYTLRLHSQSPAYWCKKSVIIHKMPSNSIVGIAYCSEDRLGRYEYDFRNRMYNYRYRWNLKWRKIFYIYTRESLKVLLYAKSKKMKRLGIIIGGFRKGLKFKPEIVFPSEKEIK